uniref:Uncharacterized protein n=1 Tax=Rhizophora mucronata TaxID=61149 RepID=A0A2P2NRX3_RHIMU
MTTLFSKDLLEELFFCLISWHPKAPGSQDMNFRLNCRA